MGKTRDCLFSTLLTFVVIRQRSLSPSRITNGDISLLRSVDSGGNES